MKFLKIFMLTLAFCGMIATSVMAAPFLVCAPYANDANAPTSFIIKFDNGEEIETPVFVVTSGVKLHYDLANISNGAHVVLVKARNMWGDSGNSVSYSFTKGIPSVPTEIGISQN